MNGNLVFERSRSNVWVGSFSDVLAHPVDGPLRPRKRLNAFVTVAHADVHEQLDPYYSEIGRPSVDPELMIRMLIIGYCYGLRSERRRPVGRGGHGSPEGGVQKAPKNHRESRARKINKFCNTICSKAD
jgi:hypothetical protein